MRNVRDLGPKRSPWYRARFDTLRLNFIKTGTWARVTANKTIIIGPKTIHTKAFRDSSPPQSRPSTAEIWGRNRPQTFPETQPNPLKSIPSAARPAEPQKHVRGFLFPSLYASPLL
jgi:hypothetical protein